MVEQPAKVMRIGSMIRQLLEEVRPAPLDEASRARLAQIHQRSIKELEDGLAPELIEELERISLPFTDDRDHPERGRAPGRARAARRLARRAVPRHPDHAVRPADGGARPARADAPRAAARRDRRRARTPPAGPGGRTCSPRRGPSRAVPCGLRSRSGKSSSSTGRRRRRRWPRTVWSTAASTSGWALATAYGPARPRQHRQVVGHVAEGHDLGGVDAVLRAQLGERAGLRHAVRAHLDQPVPLECVGITTSPDQRRSPSASSASGSSSGCRASSLAAGRADELLQPTDGSGVRLRPSRTARSRARSGCRLRTPPRSPGRAAPREQPRPPARRASAAIRCALDDLLGVQVVDEGAVRADRHARGGRRRRRPVASSAAGGR